MQGDIKTRNNLRAPSCKILLSLSLSLSVSFTPWHFAGCIHLTRLVYVCLPGTSPCDRAARTPFDESMHQGEMSARRCDIREQLRHRRGSYASAFSTDSRFDGVAFARRIERYRQWRGKSIGSWVAVYCTLGRLTLGGMPFLRIMRIRMPDT